MNRIDMLGDRTRRDAPSADFAAELAADLAGDFGAARAVQAGGDGLSTLFGPVHYETNYAYPLLVWMHGRGQTERQLVKVMPLISLRNYVAVAPRGTVRTEEVRRVAGPASTGRPSFTWSQRPEAVDVAIQRIFSAVDEAREQYHIARHRIFLAGVDAGGTMAWRAALAHPDRFAGAISFGGPFPEGRSPLSRLLEARRLPLFLAHGRDDASFSEARVSEQLRLFHSAGLQVSMRQYPCGAQLAPQMLTDIDRWMMDVVTGATTCVD
ncbi:MAG: dienelactone hydrolase family protein [Planctomycetia bacterium]|nr:dienelactone hydrolase family protein [Planctomycetia bacterium]